MTTTDLVAGPRPTLSFEVYAPRGEAATAALPRTVAELAALRPDFVSVTYGAQSPTRETSRYLVRHIRTATALPVLAHLTCVGATAADLERTVDLFLADGVRDVLALRGDPPRGPWQPPPGGLATSSELVALLAARDPRPGVAVAATAGDVAGLRAKEAAGADYAITQLFFDPADYTGLVADARAAGVRMPILPGVVVSDDPRRLAFLSRLTGVPVPPALLAGLESADGAQRRRRAALAAAGLVAAVLDAGAPGVHLYTMNDAAPVAELLGLPALDGVGAGS